VVQVALQAHVLVVVAVVAAAASTQLVKPFKMFKVDQAVEGLVLLLAQQLPVVVLLGPVQVQVDQAVVLAVLVLQAAVVTEVVAVLVVLRVLLVQRVARVQQVLSEHIFQATQT
jgi:hypothetical protein